MSYTVNTKISWAQTNRELQECFDKWGVSEWTTNYPRGARLQGFNQTEADRKVTLTYVKSGKTINLVMGSQPRAVDNLRVLYLAIEDMRMIEKRGLSETIQSAYLQIAAPQQKRDPYEVLGILPGASVAIAEIVYKNLAKEFHPDGIHPDPTKFKEITEAIGEIRKR